VAFADSFLGGVDILVNNAGVFVFRGIDASIDDWQTVLAVNVIGVSLMTKHVVPRMRRAGRGSIVNIGSVSGSIAQKGFMTYSASKAAVVAMTRCMAYDLVEDNIRVNCVSPGSVWTSQLERMADESGLSREAAGHQANMGGDQMMRRNADVTEIGHAVAFFASDEASFSTGANIMIDGGWTAI
jgi:dihydroanticapsin dehydrogenase